MKSQERVTWICRALVLRIEGLVGWVKPTARKAMPTGGLRFALPTLHRAASRIWDDACGASVRRLESSIAQYVVDGRADGRLGFVPMAAFIRSLSLFP